MLILISFVCEVNSFCIAGVVVYAVPLCSTKTPSALSTEIDLISRIYLDMIKPDLHLELVYVSPVSASTIEIRSP